VLVTLKHSTTGNKRVTLFADIEGQKVAQGKQLNAFVEVANAIIVPQKIITGVDPNTGNVAVGPQSIPAKNVVLRVSDKALVNNITLSIKALQGQLGIVEPEILNIRRDANAGTITFDVAGGINPTPASKPDGILQVQAKNGATVVATANIIVVVPILIRPVQNSPFDVAITPQNIAVGTSTSPLLDGTPAGKLGLITFYGAFTTMQVLDQFGKPLNALYAGQTIKEGGSSINQVLRADGTYLDPVGFFQPKAEDAFVPQDDFENIIGWQNADPVAYTGNRTLHQVLDIGIGSYGGFQVVRDVTLNRASDSMHITWTATPRRE
jgi:hypothetical protein